MTLDLATVTRDVFAACVGTTFTLRASADHALALELIETTALPTRPNAPRGAFLARFRVREPSALPQRIYALEHPELGAFELFLVPAGPDSVGMRYDAVFA